MGLLLFNRAHRAYQRAMQCAGAGHAGAPRGEGRSRAAPQVAPRGPNTARPARRQQQVLQKRRQHAMRQNVRSIAGARLTASAGGTEARPGCHPSRGHGKGREGGSRVLGARMQRGACAEVLETAASPAHPRRRSNASGARGAHALLPKQLPALHMHCLL
jgi:hypothetical protein